MELANTKPYVPLGFPVKLSILSKASKYALITYESDHAFEILPARCCFELLDSRGSCWLPEANPQTGRSCLENLDRPGSLPIHHQLR